MSRFLRFLPLLLILPLAPGRSQTMKAPDITREPTLYVVGYAHLDTEWRWEYPITISQYILNTLRKNFDLLDKYPHYVFTFTGANRYGFMKEYFPADYTRLKRYVAQGRWFPGGSSAEEGDVNSPNAESIFRQILYGNQFFLREFNKASSEYMLPDCFGFPASLPSILAHAGIRGFSTQKLSATWQPAPHVGGPNSPEKTPEGIPFNVGIWEGPDGKAVIAALNPGSYTGNVHTDISKSTPPEPPPYPGLDDRQREVYQRLWRENNVDWPTRLKTDGNLTGVFADYHYYGTGDIGGAPDEDSVKMMEAIVTRGTAGIPPPRLRLRGQNVPPPPPPGPPVQVGDGPVHVIAATSDQMFNDIRPDMTARMPRYQGDLELINHSAGSLTSEAYQKRWNRKNELLADAAEKASVAAEWLGALPYPLQRLTNAWTLVMGGQFHDILPGTSTPMSYRFAWNDEVLAMNQFAGVLTAATAAVASGLDTRGNGIPVVVYNPLNVAREDVVEAAIAFPGGAPAAVRVLGPDGRETPAQIGRGKVLFLARVPSVGYAVYDVRPAAAPSPGTALRVTGSSLENARYRVRLDGNGDVAGVFDKALNREMLSAPIRLAIKTDNPRQWPAWNMDFDQEQAPPRAWVGGPAKTRIVENGPARVAVEVAREAEGSKFVQTVRLSAGDAGNRVEFTLAMDWAAKEANLKAVFPLAPANETATYNWDIGTVQRPTENERQFEVASHQWIDLTDKSGAFGATVLTDCKNASDKPDGRTIRLTLVRSPGTRGGYTDQASQDWGHHEMVYGLAAHAGDWRRERTDWQGYRLNQPLIAFQTAPHAGPLGKTFALLNVSNPAIRVLAVKKAEQGDDVIVRLVETDGRQHEEVRVTFPGPIAGAREVNAQEQPLGPATVSDGAILAAFTPYQPRTFAIALGQAPAALAGVRSEPVALPYDLAVTSEDGKKSEGGFDAGGRAIASEMLPRKVEFNGVAFALGSVQTGEPNAMAARGQSVRLPSGPFNRVWVLAASADGDQRATFRAGERPVELTVEDWGGMIGQWDYRVWKAGSEPQYPVAISSNPAEVPAMPQPHSPQYPADYAGLKPGFIKRADVAWFASHNHTAEGLNQPYAYSYLFTYAIDVPPGAAALTLPDNRNIRVLAVSATQEPPAVRPVQPLYDTLER
jgi:alpha-mannosidase